MPKSSGTVGFRLCQREHRWPRDSARAGSACSHTCPETQDSGHPLRRAPTLPCKAHVSPSNCISFTSALSTFPSALLSLQPLAWVSWPQGCPSRGFEVHPKIFCHEMFQVSIDPCARCMCVHTSAVCRGVTQGGQGKTWPKPGGIQNGDQLPGETVENRGCAPY